MLTPPTSAHEAVRPARPPQVAFSFYGASSDFVLSPDERSLLFKENGPDGVVLKNADLKTGKVSILRGFPRGGAIKSFVVVPGNGHQILAAAQVGWSAGPFQTWLLSLSTEPDRELGEADTDGRLDVSPSGRYVATGTDFASYRGGLGSYIESLSIVSIQTGAVELKIPVATTTDESEGETLISSTLNSIGWAADKDVFVISTDHGADRHFERDKSGKWIETKPGSVNFALPPGEHLRSHELTVELATRNRRSLGTADCAKLFDARPGGISILRGTNTVVLVKRCPPQNLKSKTWSATAYVFRKEKR